MPNYLLKYMFKESYKIPETIQYFNWFLETNRTTKKKHLILRYI